VLRFQLQSRGVDAETASRLSEQYPAPRINAAIGEVQNRIDAGQAIVSRAGLLVTLIEKGGGYLNRDEAASEARSEAQRVSDGSEAARRALEATRANLRAIEDDRAGAADPAWVADQLESWRAENPRTLGEKAGRREDALRHCDGCRFLGDVEYGYCRSPDVRMFNGKLQKIEHRNSDDECTKYSISAPGFESGRRTKKVQA